MYFDQVVLYFDQVVLLLLLDSSHMAEHMALLRASTYSGNSDHGNLLVCGFPWGVAEGSECGYRALVFMVLPTYKQPEAMEYGSVTK